MTTSIDADDREDEHDEQAWLLGAEDVAESLERRAELVAALGGHAEPTTGPEARSPGLGARRGEQLPVVVALR